MPRSPSRNARSASRAGRTFYGVAEDPGPVTYPDPIIDSVTGSSQANTDNAITMSVDGSDYNRWLSSSSAGTLTFLMTEAAVLTGYRITTPWGGLTAAPKTWTLEGAQSSGGPWTTLDTQTNITTWRSGTSPTFTVANTTAYLYYRIVITANNGGANAGMGEFRPTPARGIATLGGNNGTMVEWWDASAITGKTDGATVAFGDLIDQAGFHNFTAAAGVITYRATGGPNSKPVLEHAVTGASFHRPSLAGVGPTGDATIFFVGKLLSTNQQQLFGGGAGGAALDVTSGKFRFMKQGIAQLAVSTTSHPTSGWFIVIATYTSSTGSTKFRLITSGADTTDTIAGTATTFSETLTGIGWGAYDTSTGAALQGSAAEMGRYASALNTGDLDTLADALKTKYGF